MDKVQASILMFVLMGIVIIITVLSVRKKPGAPQMPLDDESLKKKYEEALKAGDRQSILEVGRRYYSSLNKEHPSRADQSSKETFAGKQAGL